MKNLKFLLVILCLIAFNPFVNGQASFMNHVATSIGYRWMPNSQSYFTAYGTTFTKLDATGTEIWTQTLNASMSIAVNGWVEAPNGDIIFCARREPGTTGSSGFFYVGRMDINGNLLWIKHYNTTMGWAIRDWTPNIINADGDNYYLGSWYSGDDYLVIKIDSNGNILWNNRYYIGGDDQFSMSPDSYGGFYLSGESSGISWDIMIARIAPDGTVKFAKHTPYNANYSSGQGHINCGVAATTDAFYYNVKHGTTNNTDEHIIIKMDTLGNFLWGRKHYLPSLPINNVWEGGGYSYVDANKDVYLQGGIVLNSFQDGYFIKFDENGNLLDARYTNNGAANTNTYFGIGAGPGNKYTFGQYTTETYWGVDDGTFSGCMLLDAFTPNLVTENPTITNTSLNVANTPMVVTPLNDPIVVGVSYQQDVICAAANYAIPNDTLTCDQLNCCPTCAPKICIPLEAINTVATGIIGMDFCMNYDDAYMTPTGVVTLGDVVLNGDPNAGYYINYALTPGELHVSIYYNGQASPNAEFVGMGEVACVEFTMSSNFVAGVTVPVKLCQVLESHLTSVEDMPYLDGSITLVNDDILDGKVVYWNRNNSPLSYDNANPTNYNITNASGSDGNCNLTGLSTVQPDVNGNFQHNINNGTHLQFSRDIACGTNIMSTINGMDCYWAGLITTQNPSFVPSAFQITAANVNLDNFVTAGDITQMQKRIVLANGYDCNYVQSGGQTLDWVFTDSMTVFNDPTWQVSPNYPAGGAGYSFNNLPNLVPCLKIKTDSNGVYCTTVPYMKYHGILLGDVNGTWDPNPPVASALKTASTDKIIFDLTQATKNEDCSFNIPIFYQSNSNLMALDFDMDFDQNKVSNLSISNMLSSVMSITSNTYANDRFLFSSYSTVTGGTSTNNYVYLLKVKPISGTILNASDLGSIVGYLNGENVSVDIIGTSADCEKLATGVTEVSASNVAVFPNPMQNELVVEYPADARIQNIELYDIQGRKLINAKANATGQTILNTKELSNGVYLLQIDGKVMHKVVK